jgi:Enoyl-CoA hydratase/isomerase
MQQILPQSQNSMLNSYDYWLVCTTNKYYSNGLTRVTYRSMTSSGLGGDGDANRQLKYITIQKEESILIIRIHRPEVLNALNRETMNELESAFSTAAADDAIKIVIVTGSGERSFCAGADVTYVVNISPIEAQNYASRVHSLLTELSNLTNLS